VRVIRSRKVDLVRVRSPARAHVEPVPGGCPRVGSGSGAAPRTQPATPP